MKVIGSVFLLLMYTTLFSQTVTQRLTAAVNNLTKDSQFAHASLSMYVVDSKTGAVIFAKDPQLGMAPASTQKVVTSVSAFDLLGKGYTYKTKFGYDGSIVGLTLNGNLYFMGAGDPSFGSWRWQQTSEGIIFDKVLDVLQQKGITHINGDLRSINDQWESQATPRGWIWEDVGNYYGAGARVLNWRENQYDLVLRPGKSVGDAAFIVGTHPSLHGVQLISELTTGPRGSGDNSIIYLPEAAKLGYVRGTIPLGTETFTVKGSLPEPAQQFLQTLSERFEKNAIKVSGNIEPGEQAQVTKPSTLSGLTNVFTFVSPSLDSLNYWFLKKSINLFGEAFVKTIAFEKNGFGATDSGLAIIRHFWSQRGIEKSALKITDGSGLSPANRLTTHALVTVMQYATKQPWFTSFYHALPEMNGIKMKDGYIRGVRSYTGYIKSTNGNGYTFAFIVNNFDGSAASVREKMWRVLDILKAPVP